MVCCLCLKVSLSNGNISRWYLEQWASESFHCLPFSYTRRFPVLYLREWIYHCFGILSLVELLFASLVSIQGTVARRIYCIRNHREVGAYKIRFYLATEVAITHLSCKQVYLLTTGTDWQGRGSIKWTLCCGFDDCCTYLYRRPSLNRLQLPLGEDRHFSRHIFVSGYGPDSFTD